MPSTVTRKSYPPETADKSKSSVIDDSKKKTSLLKDNSWIKKDVTDDKVVDQHSNYGRSVLGRFKSSENLTSSSEKKTTTTVTKTSTVTDSGSVPSRKSVQSLTKRFSFSQDELDSSSTTTSFKDGTKTTVTTSRTSVKSPTKAKTFSEKIFTDSKTTTSEEIKTVKSVPPSSPTKTTRKEFVTVTTSKDNVVQEDIKTIKSVPPSSPTKTTRKEFVTVTTSKDKVVQEDIKTIKSVPPSSPTKTTRKEFVTVTTSKDNIVQEDVKTVKSVITPTSPSKTSKTVTVTTFQDTIIKEDSKSVKSTPPPTPTKIISDKTYTITTPTSKTSSYSFSSKSSTEDQLFDTLIPSSVKETYASDNRNDKSSETSSTAYTRTSYKESRPEEHITENVYTEYVKTSSAMSDSYVFDSRRGSTKTYTATYSDSRPEILLDTYKSSRSTMETLYTTPERKIYIEKDICTYCQKPILYDTKMILEDVDIKCHANCFKCGVCNSNLGHLKAGDSMWVYRRNVHCEACFGVIKGKWHR
ncbi:sciellin isoform X3 [Hemibagrus wyckioides]|uniref:sciellin isoform X3 n=1 Tax=Hemibagrus wyckioides TaxID=337641 RepID=UPI00266BD493|nr:sciellin isoform X3 [Hemibagrus wyckioides]